MKRQNEFCGLKEAAEILNISVNTLSNIRNRDDEFPKPFNILSATPIWRVEDIYKYGIEKRNLDENEMHPYSNNHKKTITLVGRARTGKSFITGMFAQDFSMYRKLFCGLGKDETICNINNIFIDSYYFSPYIEFYSDFDSLYNDISNDNKDYEEIQKLIEKIKSYKSIQMLINDEEKIKEFINNIKCVIRGINEIESLKYEPKKSNTYLNVYMKPSNFCLNIMEEIGVKCIEIIDTPGISGNISAKDKLQSLNADLYIFLLRAENDDDSKTIKSIVDIIKPIVGTSDVCFLYRMNGTAENEKRFEKIQKDAKKAMKDFEKELEGLKDTENSIINTSLDILQPSERCIGVPPMNEDEIEKPEELFQKEFSKRIINAFKNENDNTLEKLYKDSLNTYKKDVEELTLKILKQIYEHKNEFDTTSTKEYNIENFKDEKHDRVKTNDNLRIISDLSNARIKEKKLLYDYFNDKFKIKDYPDEWDQNTIKYIYNILFKNISSDDGIGIGKYHTEDFPPTTMLVEESIFAKTVYNNIISNKYKSSHIAYREALKSEKITSKTWDYVFCCTNDNDKFNNMLKKLEIINFCELCNIKVSTREDLILYRYIGGLRKFAQYKILKKVYNDIDKAKNKLKELPF